MSRRAELHNCVDEVSEKGAKHVAHKSTVSRLLPEDTLKALQALAQEK